jgi:hypothetical protein
MPIEVKRVHSPAPGLEAGVFDGQCMDLSQAGTRFRTQELFHPHEKLELTFFSADGQVELSCEVEVVRADKVSRQYEIGARITRLLPSGESDDPSPSSR